ncbi:MAG: type II toxin-antitoxin system HicA family toxin [Chloroflexota bacterium]
MPRKIRELKAELRRAGSAVRSGRVALSSGSIPWGDGEDAQSYQEHQVRAALDEVQRKES